ncbi:hypothetical protein GDO81_024661 [Engystomops pustulosus]|uniref:Secreted protein n=1 Tax=Engystomops pustulosus TaxID=76066 RepID=A0AAV6ZH51_ENGPU|nr:hypothetical protein GDO81_024661 [Engystomops pustulosus]
MLTDITRFIFWFFFCGRIDWPCRKFNFEVYANSYLPLCVQSRTGKHNDWYCSGQWLSTSPTHTLKKKKKWCW